MHIKQITISNFRSFRQQPEIQPFSKGANTVVGRNGSGKSNLFDAVQFCLLAPRFANLRQEERQALLHEGSGSAAVNAFVEIVFDNSDHRFQLENSDEVVLRRTVGLKKDEFFLQRKRASKSEVQSLLEGAGFSKSNPYFIVQQGKVQDLCTMSDGNRLRLLKEVAGTTLYDEKKAESLAKMEENNSSIEKIGVILSDIENRLDELQSEKDELNAYQQADRSRRAAEYCLYDKELRKARSQLDAVEHERADHAESISELHDTMKENHDSIREIETVMKEKSAKAKRNRLVLQNLEDDYKGAVKTYTRMELDCAELKDLIKAGIEQDKVNRDQLKTVNKKIDEAEKLMSEQIQPNFDMEKNSLQQMTEERESATRQIEALFAKQGRGRQFSTKAERDDYLRTSQQELQLIRNEKAKELSEEEVSLLNFRETLEIDNDEVQKLSREVKDQNNVLMTINKSLSDKKRIRLELHENRKDVWRKTEECQEIVREARETYHSSLSDMRKVMPKATCMGIDALANIVEKEGFIRGTHYFGMLMENMQLRDDKYRTAVEVAAQNSLFHVIVDTDHTAARLMKRLEDGKLGRLTFLPLNQLRVETVKYPDSSDIRPMLDLCLNYDSKVKRAMEHVFNKKLIARSTEVAAEWCTKLSMDVITLDGDLCSRKGALTGGYVDLSRSRLGAQARLKESDAVLKSSQLELQSLKQKAQTVDQSATALMQELQKLEAKHAEVLHFIEVNEGNVEKLQSKIEKTKKSIERSHTSTIPLLRKTIDTFDADFERLECEIGTELQENISLHERELLGQLKIREQELAESIAVQNERVISLSLRLQDTRSLLEDNLLKRRQELLEGPALNEEPSSRRSIRGRVPLSVVQSQRKEDLEQRERELSIFVKGKEDMEHNLDAARVLEQTIVSEFSQAKNELERLKNQSMKLSRDIEESQEKSERLLNKRLICISKRETYIRKIQELGSLPPHSELQKFEGKTIPELMKSLEAINKNLKKYSHVNKKAFDQFVNFSEQREALLKRKEELDRGAGKVKELIESLDRQKDEAINRTFRGVSTNFKDVFQELVPNGHGELIMRTSLDDDDDQSDSGSGNMDSDDAPDKVLGINRYCGIGIKVRFSAIGENYLMSQLSGGQKALVALALIFAIQRCDPAPFYLFDELDQALDSTYRASVASLIHRQANSDDNPTQFIVSTFRQELVSIANRCFGISHQSKVSSLHPLSKKDAKSFIANLMSEEEAVGDVTSMVASRSASVSTTSRKRKSGSSVEDAIVEQVTG